ncbi:MAG: hypothetical protein GX890_00260 [Firmicutes bacterium]|nr:hypothetical protein [Bacillota bacterium]HPU01099.1 hypothetical protein [Bacillota bacterium]
MVTPPEGWEEVEATPFLFEYNKGMSAIWVQEMEEQFDIDDPDGYIETMINSYAGAYPGAEFSSVESLKVADCDSRKFSYTTTSASSSGQPFTFVAVYIFRGGAVYRVEGRALEAEFDAFLPVFEAFINSLRFE